MTTRRRAFAATLLALLALTGCGTSNIEPSLGSVPTSSPAHSGEPGLPATPAVTPIPSSHPPVVNPASPAPSSSVPAADLVPLVPVTGFWSTERTITRATLAAAVAGSGAHPRAVFVAAGELAPLAAALRITPGPNVRATSPAKVRAAVASTHGALGILRAGDATPDVRALAVDGATLFGESRVRDLAAWPLRVAEPGGSTPSTFDPATAWTLAVGGDVMLDREVYRLAVLRGRGADWPWAGGTAAITARVCCGYPGFAIVRGRRTGNAGAVRTLLGGADLALVNLEGPAPDAFTYHPSGYVFTMDPDLLAGLAGAGIDAVSLANNHISNAGAAGIVDTARHLDALGIAHAGAGRDAADARRAAWLQAGGLKVAVLGYNAIRPAANATASRAGAASLAIATARADIRAARRAGADVVIVVPHWGREYTDAVTADQRRLARALVAAGADAVLGSHSHWAGPLELVDGHVVVYSLGDLVFDLQHDARTQQGVVAELTFSGRRLVQVDLHPTLILDASQPNLLAPDAGGNALLEAIRAASSRLGP